MTIDEERGAPKDETVALIDRLKGLLSKNKSRLSITSTVPGVGIQHWSLTATIVSSNLDLDIRADGLNLHEAAEKLEIILESVL